MGRPEGPVARLDPAGVVHYAKPATSSFDRYSRRPSARRQAWMRAHYWRMRAYSPYFDSRTRWYGNAWFYRDAYALFRGRRPAREHPEWILRDGRGRRLYIPFDCERGSCPQYAADIGNPAFRAHWIAGARASLARGYTGVFIDDVNMELRVSYGTGRAVAPRDPRTGKPMTLGAWRRYMADFMAQIRRALPGAEIVHNALWFARDDDPQVRRQLLAADLIEIERGFEDAGLTGGDGRYGFGTLLGFIDRRHADGAGRDPGRRRALCHAADVRPGVLLPRLIGARRARERHRRLAGRLVVGGLRRGPGRRGQRALPPTPAACGGATSPRAWRCSTSPARPRARSRSLPASATSTAGRARRSPSVPEPEPSCCAELEAEREGFEPSDEVDPRHTISSRARSAAPAPLLERGQRVEGWRERSRPCASATPRMIRAPPTGSCQLSGSPRIVTPNTTANTGTR